MDNPISDFFEELSWSFTNPMDANSTSVLGSVGGFLSDDTHVIISVVVTILSALLIFFGYRFYRRYKIRINTPHCNEALVGYYVKFSGRVARHNKIKMPIKEKECEFYKCKIISKWSVKTKSPGRGLTPITKLIYVDSSDKFLVEDGDMKLFVEYQNSKDIKTSTYHMRTITGTKSADIAKYVTLEDKYSSYEYIINYINRGDEITIYGKLSRRGDDYIITDTYDKEHPFRIEQGDGLESE